MAGKKNYFLKLSKARKTTYEFSDRAVKNGDLNKILEAGRWAPSCINIQPWHFVVTKNKKSISRLVDAAQYGVFHTNPNVMISVVLRSDLCDGNHYAVKNGKIGMADGIASCAMAAMNMVLAAEDVGLASCILTPDQKKTSAILKVGKKGTVQLLIGIGYEKNDAYRKVKERRPLKSIVSKETFG